MAAQPVEWVLVIYYGPSAHRATYGRLDNNRYTKDYIQLTRKEDFLDVASRLFPPTAGGGGLAPLRYRWPEGAAPGAFVFKSADRPHLKWETKNGAPSPWKMSLIVSDATAETIPGDPSHRDFAAAENEFASLASRGAGRPYLLAIKLRREPGTLHLRAYLRNPSERYAWADLNLAPQVIRDLATTTSRTSAIAWLLFQGGKAGLFFDPDRNHDAWSDFPAAPGGDAAAEELAADPEEVEAFRKQIERESYEVEDSIAQVKIRGSAQKAFAEAVKSNYGYRCAITGVVTRDFLVASHIVPWSEDQSIRLDPSNGICLSLLIDRAFEKGYLLIEDDLTVRMDWSRVGKDNNLRGQLEPYDGRKLSMPSKEAPQLGYLQRRRALVAISSY